MKERTYERRETGIQSREFKRKNDRIPDDLDRKRFRADKKERDDDRKENRRSLNKTRCFIALELPNNLVNEALNAQKELKKQDLIIGNYTKTENIHLTLKFLGEIDDEMIEKTKERLSKIKMQRFGANFDELGVFSEEFVRIIWIHLNGQSVLDLQKAVDDSLENLFPREERFQSHITVARVHNLKNKEDLITYIKSFRINSEKEILSTFSLVKSTLTSQGPVYEIIERYELE